MTWVVLRYSLHLYLYLSTGYHDSILEGSEKTRQLDRIRAVTFREARDAGAAFITRSWVALGLKRSEDFVKRNWRKAIEDCEFRGGRPEQQSQEFKNIALD